MTTALSVDVVPHEPAEDELLYRAGIDSPVGPIELEATTAGLTGVYFTGHQHRASREALTCAVADHPLLAAAAHELAEYFSGRRRSFSVPLAPVGNEFQLRCWRELARIPYGRTISYGEQARRLGIARAAQAVGVANGRNPLSIVVPCHRVIGADGSLHGYAGGLDVKRWLLEHEGALAEALF